jgi:hypothetical protein
MARITLGFRIYPDIDDTAVVVLALLEAGPETEVWPSLHVVPSCVCHAQRSLGL